MPLPGPASTAVSSQPRQRAQPSNTQRQVRRPPPSAVDDIETKFAAATIHDDPPETEPAITARRQRRVVTTTRDDVRLFLVKSILPRLMKTRSPETSAAFGGKRKAGLAIQAWNQACAEFGCMQKGGAYKRVPSKADPEYTVLKQRAQEILAHMKANPNSSSATSSSSSSTPLAQLGPEGEILKRGKLPLGFVAMVDRASGVLYAEPDPALVDDLYSLTQHQASVELFALKGRAAVLRDLFKIAFERFNQRGGGGGPSQ